MIRAALSTLARRVAERAGYVPMDDDAYPWIAKNRELRVANEQLARELATERDRSRTIAGLRAEVAVIREASAGLLGENDAVRADLETALATARRYQAEREEARADVQRMVRELRIAMTEADRLKRDFDEARAIVREAFYHGPLTNPWYARAGALLGVGP